MTRQTQVVLVTGAYASSVEAQINRALAAIDQLGGTVRDVKLTVTATGEGSWYAAMILFEEPAGSTTREPDP